MKLFQYTHILLSMFAVMVVIQLAKVNGPKESPTLITASEKTFVSTDTSLEEVAPAAHYNARDNSWSVSVQVLEIKDVSIYGRPGSIARIAYVCDRDLRVGWAALRIDNYSFNHSSSAIAVGDQLILKVSGNYTSSKGVDWSRCPASDEFCQHASFIEGGFPISKDYGGLTISPSNSLIFSGKLDDDWINGMLAWQIISEH
jgi:hypothetical protein